MAETNWQKDQKIIPYENLPALITTLKTLSKSIAVAGGCFDILHEGHVAFLKKSKEQADLLILLLESDARIKKLKGENRPINNQLNRARVLASLSTVDYIILLPEKVSDQFYDELIFLIKPAIITSTKGDPYRIHKERQAMLVGAEVRTVIDRLSHVSTSKFADVLKNYEQ